MFFIYLRDMSQSMANYTFALGRLLPNNGGTLQTKENRTSSLVRRVWSINKETFSSSLTTLTRVNLKQGKFTNN
jgi:hypothetical protein